MAGERPSLAKILEEAIDNRLMSLNTMLPGKVVKVDNAAGKCDVQPLLKIKYSDETVVDMPVITNAAIGFYRAGKAAIYLPVHVGDTVEIRFSQRSLDIWKSKGGTVDPLDPRKFHISDAVVYPGLYPFTDPPEGASASDIVIKNEDATLIIKTNELNLYGSGDAIALASKVMTELNAIKTAFDSHTHLYSPGPGGPTPTAAPAAPMPTPNDVKSEKVKAE